MICSQTLYKLVTQREIMLVEKRVTLHNRGKDTILCQSHEAERIFAKAKRTSASLMLASCEPPKLILRVGEPQPQTTALPRLCTSFVDKLQKKVQSLFSAEAKQKRQAQVLSFCFGGVSEMKIEQRFKLIFARSPLTKLLTC
jgi:hypothetical protein